MLSTPPFERVSTYGLSGEVGKELGVVLHFWLQVHSFYGLRQVHDLDPSFLWVRFGICLSPTGTEIRFKSALGNFRRLSCPSIAEACRRL